MSVSTFPPVIIDGQSLSLESVARVAFDRAEVILDKRAAPMDFRVSIKRPVFVS